MIKLIRQFKFGMLGIILNCLMIFPAIYINRMWFLFMYFGCAAIGYSFAVLVESDNLEA